MKLIELLEAPIPTTPTTPTTPSNTSQTKSTIDVGTMVNWAKYGGETPDAPDASGSDSDSIEDSGSSSGGTGGGLQGEPPANIPLADVVSKSGVRAKVGTQYARQFQGLINDLENSGYQIKELGGYNHRKSRSSNRWSAHAWGAALDINPSENPFQSTRTTLPNNTSQIASKWGLGWGMNWKSVKDPMHFSADAREGGNSNMA